LWESLVLASGIEAETKWADLSKHNCKTYPINWQTALFKWMEKYF
jgi:hypothetical protein